MTASKRKGCGHEAVTFRSTRLNDDLWVTELRCLKCRRPILLGPANDELEAVRVEMRAAEIAADLDDADRLCDWTLANEAFIGFTAFDERRGWSIAETNMQEHSSAWHAGYLARRIHDHQPLPPDGERGGEEG